MQYGVDLRDVKFQLLEWLPIEELMAAEPFAEWDRESVEMVVDQAVQIAQEVLAPVNEEGDRLGAKLEGGRVTLPPPYLPAYRTVAEGGWIGSIHSPEYGGLGLPHAVGSVVNELFSGANMGLSVTFLLTRGASDLIEAFGSDEMRGLFCEKLYSGQWTGTMCLTEPQAGSDVGATTTRAIRKGDGRYLLFGEKIFITSGDHDLTENIVHAVLARLPDAPAGTGGLSLFIVPKVRVNPDGTLGEPNDVVCGGIEHKLGIHGSATCSLLFGQNGACEGLLLGRENAGMKLMFQMMNAARIEVGLQGVAVAGAAHQAALAFAKERLQGRHWSRLADRDAPQVPIVEHPDVRRMLFTSSAYVQAMRALLLKTSFFIDRIRISDGEERDRYRSFVELLTPVCKAWATDWGVRVTDWCLQVYGGYGYTKDYPAEQYLRDVRITSIYEGTNGIQALDLVGRRLTAQGGRAVRELLAMAAKTARQLGDDPQLSGAAALLGGALQQFDEVFSSVARRPDAALVSMLNAVPILDMLGNLLGAYFLLDQAKVAGHGLATLLRDKGVDPGDKDAYGELVAADANAAFYHNKVQSAIHFAYRVLPTVTALGVAVRAGEKAPMDAVM